MPLLIVGLSGAVFCAMILNLAAKPKFTRGLIGACTLLACIGGLVMYGLGFAAVLEDPLQMLIRTVLDVCRMFAGINDYGAVSAAPLFGHRWVVTLFWVLHLMAFYATASATISTLGAAAMKRLKFWLQRYGSSVVIYGATGKTVEFAGSLTAAGVKNIVFVDAKPEAAVEAAVNSAGCLMRTDSSALKPDAKFLNSIGSDKGSPVLTLYALNDDEGKNRIYAQTLLEALQAADVDTARVKLVMRSADDSVESGLSRTAERYGYGDVRYFSDVSLSGRMLMQKMPPCEKMSFQADGRAVGNFGAVVIGFGRMGRNVLRQLVRNAQFEGSQFSAAVFSTAIARENGYFCSSYPELVKNYDIRFMADDARSLACFDYVRENAADLRYVVICTGDTALNREIYTEMNAFLQQLHCDAAVCCCEAGSLAWSVTPGAAMNYCGTYTAEAIGSGLQDRRAMLLNYSYVNDPAVTPEEAWSGCGYFSRESSRAAADFICSYARMVGKAESELAENGWGELDHALQENLGRTEHLRWCAFHYSMGFAPMTDEQVRNRGEALRAEREHTGSSRVNISKDLTGRRHSCLRSWEELDALAALEAEYTGVCKDYKDMDVRNVLALPAVLRAEKESKA